MKLKKNICFILLFILIASPLLAINASASDTNLALNKTYTFEFDSPIENAFPLKVNKDESMKLTDGKKAQADTSDSNWLKFYRGTKITLTLDLGEVYSVKSVNLGQLNLSAAGIFSTRYLYTAVSEDGENFGTVGSVIDEKTITNTATIKVNSNITFDSYFKARYVRFIFSSDVNTWCDEIEVFGSTDASLGVSAAIDETPKNIDAYPNDVDGLRNIVLMYSNKYYKGNVSDVGMNTFDEILPYFAYVDKSKKVIDTMFDGMLFLPLTPTTTQSTGEEEYAFTKKTGWEMYLESVIGLGDTNYNIAALNDIVGEYKTQLNLDDDYKYPVYISVPYIEKSTIVFGKIDGKLIDASTFENRVKIVEWFIDYVISSFNKAGFENIQLNGMYWQHEVVPYSVSEYEDDLIKAYNAYVHEKEYSSIWIPYYCAPGYETWKELGFDAAVVQNAYSFIEYEEGSETGPKKPGTVDDSLMQAKKYGIGMEIELSGYLRDGNAEAYNRLYKIIHSAYTEGLMENGLVMYYQGGGPGILYNCAYSNNSSARKAYDLIYDYIKKSFRTYTPAVEENQFIIVEKDSSANGTVKVVDEDTSKNLLKVEVITEPKNTKVTFSGQFYSVVPNEGFVGQDSFSIKFNDGYNISEEATIKIYVSEELLNIRSTNGTLKDNTANIYNKAGKQTETDSTAFEVVVGADGKIISVGGNNNTVPDGGYIIAAKGDAQTYLKNAEVNIEVLYDKITDSIVFIGFGGSVNVESEPSESEPIVQEDSGIIIWIIIGACVLIVIVIGAFIIKKSKNTKGE